MGWFMGFIVSVIVILETSLRWGDGTIRLETSRGRDVVQRSKDGQNLEQPCSVSPCGVEQLLFVS